MVKVEYYGRNMQIGEPSYDTIEITVEPKMDIPLQCLTDIGNFIQKKLGEEYYEFFLSPIHGLNTGYLHAFFSYGYGMTKEELYEFQDKQEGENDE